MEKLQFKDLKISESIKDAIEALGYQEMTPIQEMSLPVILDGKDVIAQAPTGTGKTCVFAIRGIELVDPMDESVQVLALCPTRELALQVTNEYRKIAVYSQGVRITTIYGGQDIDIQIKALRKNPQIIVGTPGRVIDHLKRKTLKINNLKLLILDEADEMLDMGFREDLDLILKNFASHDHQTLLFSATVPDAIKKISKTYQKDSVLIKTMVDNTMIPDIDQFYVELTEANKTDCLSRMIDTYNFKQALVFCRTKRKVDELSMALTSRGYPVECLHGDVSQTGREKVMQMFRDGLVRVLIATDVAARGLDIKNIDVVFNYDITDDVEYYIHRIGRTARAGRSGAAYTFVVKREVSRIKEFADSTKTKIVQIAPPSYEVARQAKIKNTLKELLEANQGADLSDYITYLNEALEDSEQEFSISDIAAAFLKQIIDTDVRFRDAGLDLSSTGKRKDYTRMFLNLGRKDDLTKSGLTDLVANSRIVSKAQIVEINIMNTYSFFEIPTPKAELVIADLKGQMYNGRIIDLEVTKPKEDGGSKRSYGEDRRGRRPSRDGGDDRSSRRSSRAKDGGSSERRPRREDGERKYASRSPKAATVDANSRKRSYDKPASKPVEKTENTTNAVVRGTKPQFKTTHGKKNPLYKSIEEQPVEWGRRNSRKTESSAEVKPRRRSSK